MKARFFYTIILSFILINVLQAQSIYEAARLGMTTYQGTARSIGTANSLGALGADMGTLATNPAGIAAFRRSELLLSPIITVVGTESDFLTNNNTSSITKFSMANAGLVIANIDEQSDLKTKNFAFGYNRLEDYANNFSYSGYQQGSIADYFLDFAQGFLPEDLYPFEEGLAASTELIYNPLSSDETYWESDFFPNQGVVKSQTVNRSGSQGEMFISGGMNYNHKLYFGATIGIPIVSFTETKNYNEIDSDDEVAFFNELDFQESIETSGLGINLKLGLIYRVNQKIRLGAAFHTPSIISLTDSYVNDMDFNLTLDGGITNQTNSATSPDGIFNYSIRTPMKLIADAGVVIGKRGFLSGEIEWVNYNRISFKFDEETSSPGDLQYEVRLNNLIETRLKPALNIRLGGEVVLGKYQLRGGYAIYGSPLEESDVYGHQVIALGAGMRHKNFFVDLGYNYNVTGEVYTPYVSNDGNSPVVDNTITRQRFLLTLGLKF